MKPRFNLRDLFWLIALVAIGLGWWVDRSRQAALADHWEREWDSVFWKLERALFYRMLPPDPEA